MLYSTVMKSPRLLGIFASLNVSGTIRQTDTFMEWYNKAEHSGLFPKFDIINDILNYIRIFHSDYYKIIPRFELTTP